MKTKSLRVLSLLTLTCLAAPLTLSRAESAASLDSPSSSSIATNYKTVAGDMLTIVVSDEERLSGDFQISGKGEISFPLLEQVKVAGMTPAQISAKLKEDLEKDYLVHAYVRVYVKQFRTRVVSVMGEVQHPMAVEFTGEKPLSVLEAISRAGGWTKIAKKSRIYIIRDKKKIPFDYEAYLKNPDRPDIIIMLEDGDTVIVEESVI